MNGEESCPAFTSLDRLRLELGTAFLALDRRPAPVVVGVGVGLSSAEVVRHRCASGGN